MAQDKKIVIIDYNMGNVRSVSKALEMLADDVLVTNKKEEIENSDYLILPGVGAFEEGIKKWKHYLKQGGYIALSEITWTTNSRPSEIEEHWKKEYPQIDTASSKMKILEENGFSPVGFFFLPEGSWINNYYKPMEDRFDIFLTKHNYSEWAQGMVNAEKDEIKKYRTYKDYFSYGFYIARKLK